MAEYAVNTVNLRHCAQQISSLRSELESVAVRLGAMQLGSVLRIRATTALLGQLSDCKVAVVHHSQNIASLANGLTDIADLYERYERALSEPTTAPQAEIGDSLAPGNGVSGAPDWLRDILDVVGEGSPIFGLGAAIADMTGGTAADVSEGIGGLFDVIGESLDAVFASDGSVKADWVSQLFGFGKTDIDSLSDSVDDFLDDFNFGQQSSTAGKASVICQWAGTVMTFITSGFENYEEHGGFNAAFWGETVLEGAVDVGVSAGVGILVAAALPATAPAIVAGIITGGVVLAANAACEAIFDRDIAECVSDAVGAVGNAVVSGVNAVCDWIGGWFD